jgi:HD-like signal output (HDOD) protein
MLANGFHYKLYQGIMQGDIEMPHLPDVAVRISEAVQNPIYGADTIVKILQSDPPLVAHIMKVSESSMYRASRGAQNLQSAVNQMGLEAIRNITLSFCLKNLFTPKNHWLKRLTHLSWRQSIRIGSMSAIFAARSGIAESDRALLAGLLQDIGYLALLAFLDKFPEQLEDKPRVLELLKEASIDVGAVLLRSWNMQDSDLLSVISSREDWLRNDSPTPELADIVLMARYHAYIGTAAFKDCPRLSEIPAYQKLQNLSLSPHMSKSLIEDSDEEIKNISGILQATMS